MIGLSLWNSSRDDGFRTSCPVCGNRLIGDSEKGEQVCPTCGYLTIPPAASAP